MGCFDSVFVNCGTCGKRIEFQSKAGGCRMNIFNIPDAGIPPVIAGDLDGECRDCSCGKTIRIKTTISIQVITE